MARTSKASQEAKVLETTLIAKKKREKRAAKPKASKPVLPTGIKPSEFIQREVQKFMLSPHRDGRLWIEKIIEATGRRAIDMRSGQGKASTELLLAYGFDKPRPSEVESEAIANGGIKLVYVDNSSLKDVPIRRGELPEPKPDFIDGEVIDDK